MTLIRQFTDGTTLTFGRGLFDEWCVLLSNTRVRDYAPRDTEYFTRLCELAEAYDAARVYRDFVQVYAATDAQLRPSVLAMIDTIASGYPAHRQSAALIFTLLYATMVAEENKHKAILKKRIKRLAVHQLLVEHLSVPMVATFSKGRRWQQLDAECRRRGF